MNQAYRNRMQLGLIGALLVGLLVSGCALVGIRTEGEAHGMHWYTRDYRNYMLAVEEREVYTYTLVLDENEGRAVTFTKLQAGIRNNPHSRGMAWEKTGRWHLAAQGTVVIDLGSWRHCHTANCHDWGPLAPVWHLVLIGTDARGNPVRKIIDMRLPSVNKTARIT